ncbi:hypothetical protein [Kitasatospora sp. NPDC056800]|uniref:hypothetical protein n=1 Tax=Kitasatospora sp. NPDC056800 TaxID=3345948 RepID=UPI0036AAE433
MNWISLAGTALGALIALLATSLNDRVKWRREQSASHRALCQQTYARFLAALTDAHERMRTEARTDHQSAEARATAVLEAFHTSGCYPLRYELAIIASQPVLDGAEEAFKLIRQVRDLLAAGTGVEAPEYKELRYAYGPVLRNLQARMRAELGSDEVQLTGGG